MEYYKKKSNENNIDFELDLTEDTEINYIKTEKEKKNNIKDEVDIFIEKFINLSFFLSGFFVIYILLKIKKDNKKKIENEYLNKIYNKKIYKKKYTPEL